MVGGKWPTVLYFVNDVKKKIMISCWFFRANQLSWLNLGLEQKAELKWIEVSDTEYPVLDTRCSEYPQASRKRFQTCSPP